MSDHGDTGRKRVVRIFSACGLAAVLRFSSACQRKPAPVWLVENGQPRAEIVIAEEPARMTRLAASELQTYIEKISGAVLPIVTEPSGEVPRIFVGVSPHTERLGLDTDGLKYGAYRMASGPDWLALLGPDKDFEPIEPWGRRRDAGETRRMNLAWDEVTGDTFWNPFHSLFMWYNAEFDFWAFDDRGTLHAVYAFLDDLGVRWYMPGELGEVVPERRNIALPAVDATVHPDSPVRLLRWFQQHQPVSAEDTLWRLRLRLHRGHDVIGMTQQVHGMKFMHRREEMKEAHPEFYALRAGDRASGFSDSGAPCLSSEGLFEKHVAYARAVFDHVNEPMISIDLVDGFSGVGCGCEACREQITPERGMGGSMSDYVWGYLSRVAWAVYESHPDRWVSGLTYGTYYLPPERIEQMAPNFVLIALPRRMTFHDARERAEFDGLLDTWREKLASGRVFVWSNVMFNWRRSEQSALLPVYVHRQLAEHVRSLQGISGGELIECCEENWPRMRTEAGPIDRAFELIEAAQAAVDPDSVYGRRIGLVAEYLEFARPLREQLSREREGPEILLPLRSAADLTIDGRLDDAFWDGVPVIPLVAQRTGEAPRVATTVRMAWADNESLIIGIRCEEPDMAGVVDAADGASGIWTGDYIDLVFETPVHRYYQITVSPSGAVLDMDRSRGLHTHWSSQAVVATHQGEDNWTVEIQLPSAGEDAAEMDPNTGGCRQHAAGRRALVFQSVPEPPRGGRRRSDGRGADRHGALPRSLQVRAPCGGGALSTRAARAGDDSAMNDSSCALLGEAERFCCDLGSGFDVPERFAELWGGGDLR